MRINTEYIDRIIIIAKKEIEGKQQVDVKLVQALISALESLNNKEVMNSIGNEEYQQQFFYD